MNKGRIHDLVKPLVEYLRDELGMKPTHAYELIAAYFGYKSYAAMKLGEHKEPNTNLMGSFGIEIRMERLNHDYQWGSDAVATAIQKGLGKYPEISREMSK